MAKEEYKWNLGEVATIKRTVRPMKEGSINAYGHYVGSRYICIREASEGQQGILLKVLGKVPGDYIKMVDGEPFCRDEQDDLFAKTRYLSYQFPTQAELKEALDIIRNDTSLVFAFDRAQMHINPRSTFWVRETANRFLFLKRPKVYDAFHDVLDTGSSHGVHYRVSIVHFNADELFW